MAVQPVAVLEDRTALRKQPQNAALDGEPLATRC